MKNIITFTLLLLIAKFCTCNRATNETRAAILRDIIFKLNNRTNSEKLKTKSVEFIKVKKSGISCESDFFICAEMFLKKVHENEEFVGRILRWLSQFNKFQNEKTCNATSTWTDLNTVMIEILQCAIHERDR